MKKQIYLDNACTSFPKADTVPEVIYEYLKNSVSNINRSSYKKANIVEEIVFDTRDLINVLFNGYGSENVVFTKNITESLNFLIKGLFKDGDHILVSSIEHNAVMRPLVQMAKIGVSFDRITADNLGDMQIDSINGMIKKNTKAIIMTGASNVNGTKNPIEEVGKICRDNNLFFILDSAQIAGYENIDMKKYNIDCIAFTGHKSLLGPQGIGGFLLTEQLAEVIEPLISGGTGSMSDKETIPEFMPDKFEAGTMNVPGIIGLNTSIKYLNNKKINNIKNYELELTKYFLDGLIDLENKNKLNIIGHKDLNNRVPVISITTNKMDLAELSFKLDEEYGIMTRVGLHCAPNAHKTFNTFPNGTLRFSIGHKNDKEDINTALSALDKLLK